MRPSSSSGALWAPLLVAACLMPGTIALGQDLPAVPKGTETVLLQRFVTNPTGGLVTVPGEPLDLVPAPDGSGRLLVASKVTGQVHLVKNSVLQSTPFLDLPARAGITLASGPGGDERGLLGMAFHPNFAAAVGTPGRGKFYTFNSDANPAPGGANAHFSHPEILPATALNHQTVIREWNLDPAADTITSAPRELMRINKVQGNHNGGALRFDTTGNLYISLGDGGGGNDFSGGKDSPTDGHTNVTGNAQDTSNVYGKILRINPTDTSGNGRYSIPAGNPFAAPGNPGLDEIFVYGLRNPFRMNFDRANGNLYVGDVGQGEREEVDLVRPTDGGAQYGWPYIEGTLDNTNYDQSSASSVVPIGEYGDTSGVSVIGGFVYRGNAMPGLRGKYIFGEYRGPGGTSPQVGRLYYMDTLGGPILEFNYDGAGYAPDAPLLGWGEDQSGELYALFQNGQVVRVVPEPGALSLLAVVPLLAGRRRRRGV